MIIFLIGVLEMIILTTWTKAVTRARVVASGGITLLNVFVWYYVLETILSNMQNFSVVILYALGCATGTMLGTYFLGINHPKIATTARTKQDSDSRVLP